MALSINKQSITALHVGKYFPPHHGGMETYMMDLLFSSKQHGMECAAIVHTTGRAAASTVEEYKRDHDQVLVVRAATWFKFLYVPISPSFAWNLSRLIARQRPDVIHLHLPNPSALWSVFIPSARRITWIIHWQSDIVTAESGWMLKILYWLIRPLEYSALKKARYVITSSPTFLPYSLPLRRFREKCVIIPLGIRDNFEKSECHSSIRDRPLRVVALGRLAHYKGYDVLLRAIHRTKNIELDIVGDGEQASSLKKIVSDLAISKRVRLHGAATDAEKERFLRESDCLCLPSTDRTESFGVVLLEAMSASKACVVSDVEGSGMSWIVDHEVTGLVFKNRSVSALAATLERLEQDRQLAIDLGQKGRAKYEQNFTIDHTTAAVLSLYGRRPAISESQKG